ncbi:MAG: hypothetical protein ACHBN1_28830 [Heteroscytonema crispum UTEX LB 1556]
MPNAQCPIPNSQCPIPNAQCPVPLMQRFFDLTLYYFLAYGRI